MKVNNYPVKSPSTGDRLFGSDSNGDQKQFDMYAVSSNVFQYEIGEYVVDEGGVISHRWLSDTSLGSPEAGSFQNYLVVDTTNLSTNASWGLVGTDVSNCESTWDGATNTSSIISAGAAVGTAAVLCNDSTNNGKSDWYLPAIDELSKIFQNRFDIYQGITIASGTQINAVFYVASTEIDANNAYGFGFTTGHISTTNKGNGNNVRAVRKFSI